MSETNAAAAGSSGAAGKLSDAGVEESGGVVAVASAPLSAAVRAWWDYKREGTYDAVASDVSVPMRDDVTLACNLSRPGKGSQPASGKFPGLMVEYTPYALAADTLITEASFFARHGYNAIVCQVRGAGTSGGMWNHAATPQDGLDAHDVIEWLATQSFADGHVGQFGGSYGGATSYQAAAEHPPHLLATAPMISPGSLYQDVIYPGGIKTTEGGDIDVWPDSAELLSLGRINAADEYAANRAHPTYDDYWQPRAITPRVASIKVPILGIGGWLDGNFRSGMLANVEAALDNTWVIYGQWPHLSPVSYQTDGTECGTCVPEPLPYGVTLAWFDHWVMQLPDVPLPPKPMFISEEGPRGAGKGWQEVTWQTSASPSPHYELGSDGTLASAASATEAMTFREPLEPSAPGGSATFTTAPLAADHVLIGHADLHVRATLSAADASFYVELIDLDDKRKESLVNDGFLKASHRESDTDPTPVTPGAAVDYVVSIRAEHYRFVAGHSVRLRISGGKSTALVPVTTPVEIVIQTGSASTLHLSSGW